MGRKRLYALDKKGQTNPNAAAVGMADAVVSNTVRREGQKIVTEICLDLGTSKAAIASGSADLDIIGVATLVSHLGQLTAAVNGYITNISMVCTEVPATGADDIDLYVATEATGVMDALVTDLTETVLVTKAAAWAAGQEDHFVTSFASDGTPRDLGLEDKYLYLCNGEAVAGTYSAGKLVITIEGIAPVDSI
jgi:hypothetical protein